jgi:WD40 repeat protein
VDVAVDATPAAQLLRDLPERRAWLRAALAERVANPVDVDRFAPPVTAPSRKATPVRGFRPSAYPDLEGSPVEYLILSDASLASTLQDLADWKTRRGVPTVVRTLDFVLSQTRAGSDQAETVRNFIRDAYERWGIRWVLLAGDTDVLQTRLVHSSFVSPPEDVPTDLYFGCLDGTWNANGNDLYGEAATGGMNLGDSVDLFPEVHVSRAPLTSVEEAQRFVQKTIGYETPLVTTYQDSLLLLAEVLSPSDYDTTQSILLDGAALMEQLRSTVLPGGLAQARYYETSHLYPGSQPLSKAAALAALETGPHIVNHMGHGFRFNMSVADASIVNPEAYALANGDRSFLLFLLNCTALAYDGNSLGEQFLLAPDGGAVGVVGSSRQAYPTSSIDYNEDFYVAVFGEGKVHLGQAVTESRLDRTIFTFFDNQDRWTHFILNVLGDPELMLFTGAPASPTVTHADTLGLDASSVLVHVEADAVPVDSARVCLWKGDEAYAVGWTDGAGDVQLPVEWETPGTVLVTVSGRNLQTYLGSIEAVAPAAPHPVIVARSVDDDSTGTSAGNADGVVDAGESIEWLLEIGNTGGQTAGGLVAQLLLPGGGDLIAGIDSVLIGDLAPQDSLGMPVANVTFSFQVDAAVADLTTFMLQVALRDSVGTLLNEQNVPLVVHAPEMELVEIAPQGTGAFRVVLKNFGSGTQPALAGSLSTVDPDVGIVQAAASFDAIASLQTGTSAEILQVTESDTTTSNFMTLDLSDATGRAVQFTFELREPTSPGAIVLDASPGPTEMRLAWPPNADADLFGYHVYRRLFGAGGFTRVTGDIVHQSTFHDVGLLPSTRYEYQVVAVDSSRQFSAPSPVSVGSTNPQQLAGWPLPMGAATSSSVALGDIDGDGDLELVTGDDHVYAWHHTGAEVRNGDNDAVTWGIFNDTPFTVAASIALGELDPGHPGVEIIAAAWNDNRIFAYDGDGNVLSGWPVQPANGGTPGYWATPTVVDLDGDGVAEVLAASKDGHLYGFDAAGQPLVGGDGSFGVVGAFTRSSPAVANLDADPDKEIVMAGADGVVRVWNRDGSALSLPIPHSWPVALGAATYSSPAIGEIDGDPTTPEIVLTSENDLLHVLDAFGNPLPGWPKAMPVDSPSFAPSVALGDVDNDGFMDIFVVANATPADQTELRAYDGQTGALFLQKNLGDRSESSPVLADVDGDGAADVLVGGESGLVQAWRMDGTVLDGFPLTVGDFVRSTPALADFDADGDAEILLAGWDRNVYVWDLGSTWNASAALWPTYAHDMQRSGSSSTPLLPTDAGTASQAVPRRFAVHANVPNPFNPATTIRFDLPQRQQVTIDVYDVRGRHVSRLLQDTLDAGPQQLLWRGHDTQGRAVGSGIYWLRVQTAEESASRKMVLLR